MLSSKNKKIITHSNLCPVPVNPVQTSLLVPNTVQATLLGINPVAENQSHQNSHESIIDVLVCGDCGYIYCIECFDLQNHDETAKLEICSKCAECAKCSKCTRLFCALFDITSSELIDASQAFCGHYSHSDDQDECFVCHENICTNCRVEHLMRFYCNSCMKRCLFCAKPTEISKAQSMLKNIDNISKKIQILQNSICAKCGLPACDDCLDYDFLCPGCSGEQSG